MWIEDRQWINEIITTIKVPREELWIIYWEFSERWELQIAASLTEDPHNIPTIIVPFPYVNTGNT
jgi:hypothetical protein